MFFGFFKLLPFFVTSKSANDLVVLSYLRVGGPRDLVVLSYLRVGDPRDLVVLSYLRVY